ncbi:MAG TPA: molybdopterin cofactor-binding domain-containing protein [Azospirillum sp.]
MTDSAPTAPAGPADQTHGDQTHGDQTVVFQLNGRVVEVRAPAIRRLSDVLRLELGLTGTKVGCNAGDCGACTVRLDGRQVCACLTPLGRVAGRRVETVEGLSRDEATRRLQRAFHRFGAAQCGVCTPGMLMAAADLLARVPAPDRRQVEDALGGVLCRCTGYRAIVDAVLHAARPEPAFLVTEGGRAVGMRLPKVDGLPKLTGAERYGADAAPADALWLRAVRSPHARARFTVGDLAAVRRRWPGLVAVLSAADIPFNRFGVMPHLKDQPALAEGQVRFRGEAVLALVGDRDTIETLPDEDLPIVWEPREPVEFEAARAGGAADPVHAERPDHVLVGGRVVRGDLDATFAAAAVHADVAVRTSFVEHAYIEPEAGYARRVGDRIEVVACTQSPYMDLEDIAAILKLPREAVRVVPTAVGGGFGGKLDLSLQPLIAVAAWRLGRPVRCVYTRPESMASTTKRHPAAITARACADTDGRLLGYEMTGDFNTGAYASWGPTVANRVPVHATGPYHVASAVRALSRAILTNDPPAGAFRGFGVPQAAIAHEALMDTLAAKLGMDALEFRLRNALRPGQPTATGQVLEASAGLAACLEALRPHWRQARAAADAANATPGPMRRGVGVACMWYGIGNTSLSNPSSMRVGLKPDGRLTLYNGAVDIGQGSNTVMVQICADAVGAPVDRFDLVMGDTDRTADAGKTSASRQTFVSGKAVELAGLDLRGAILRRLNAGGDARLEFGEGIVRAVDAAGARTLILAGLPRDAAGDVLSGTGRFDPPTTALDADGQGIPYATYGFAAQIAEVAVDVELGTVSVLRMVAAHDVGKAVNPQQVEGQIHGGIAQGIGLALMEEYVPGRTENLHDYLIPTCGDVPDIECILIEDAEPLGPYGAKGVGEPALVPTPAAILNAIHHATGARVTHVPATPERVRAALKAQGVIQ